MKVKLNLLPPIDPPYSVNMHHATSTWFQCNRKLQAHTMCMCVCVSASMFVCQKGCQTTCLMYRRMPHIRLAKKGWKIPIMKQRTMRMHNKHTRTSRAAKCGQSNWQAKKKIKINEKAIKKKEDIKTEKQTRQIKEKPNWFPANEPKKPKVVWLLILSRATSSWNRHLTKMRETMPELRSSLARRICWQIDSQCRVLIVTVFQLSTVSSKSASNKTKRHFTRTTTITVTTTTASLKLINAWAHTHWGTRTMRHEGVKGGHHH